LRERDPIKILDDVLDRYEAAQQRGLQSYQRPPGTTRHGSARFALA
jgi:hypothetical protein